MSQYISTAEETHERPDPRVIHPEPPAGPAGVNAPLVALGLTALAALGALGAVVVTARVRHATTRV